MKIKRFEEVGAWQEARLLVKLVYKAINYDSNFAKDIFLTNQIQAAAISAMSNIAEGFSRNSNREFKHFLFIAKASAVEVQSQLYVALDQGYLKKDFEEIYAQADKVSKMCLGLIKYLAASSLTQPKDPNNPTISIISSDVKLGQGVKLAGFVNLYGCNIGDETKIGTFVEIQKNVSIGKRCKIQSHSFICEGVTIEDEVFVGHGVIFINDMYPRATSESGRLQTEEDWTVIPTLVRHGASIGSNATILAGITIGEKAIVGAGSVVTKDVPAHAVVAGNPARIIRYLEP